MILPELELAIAGAVARSEPPPSVEEEAPILRFERDDDDFDLDLDA